VVNGVLVWNSKLQENVEDTHLIEDKVTYIQERP